MSWQKEKQWRKFCEKRKVEAKVAYYIKSRYCQYMSIEDKPGDNIGNKMDELRDDLKNLEKEGDDKKPPHRVDFKGRNDDPPKDGRGGVREPKPKEPGPKNLGGVALRPPSEIAI